MLVIILMLLVSVFSIGLQTKTYLNNRRVCEEAFKHSSYDFIYQSRVYILFHLTLFIGSAIAFFYGFKTKDTTTIALGIISLGIGITEVLAVDTNVKFYYNDSGIITNGKVIKYRSIKEIKRKRLAIGKMYDLITLSNDNYRINRKAVDIILEKSRFKFNVEE